MVTTSEGLSKWLDKATVAAMSTAVLLPLALLLYGLATAFYNLALHPLRSYPGPLLWRITQAPHDWHAFNGTLHDRVVEIHKRYGPVARLGPNELSFTSSQARREILAHHPGKEEFPKDMSRVSQPPNGMQSILQSDKDTHTRFRRLLSYAFSEKGLREQEPHIRKHIDLFVDNLTKRARSGDDTVDLVEWFNMITFDIIGYLAFGRSFNCLENGGKLHSWIPKISGNVKFTIQEATCKRWGLGFLTKYLLDSETRKGRLENYRYALDSVTMRMEEGQDKGDFWDRVLIKSEKNDVTGEGMNKGEMLNNSGVLVLGGSETSATALSGAVYLLLNHTEKLTRLVTEVRSSFEASDQMTVHSVHQLEYLSAVLDETMRLYPPVVQQQPRTTPPGGGTVLGQFIPEGTTLGLDQLAANRAEQHFHRCDDFLPERWLPDLPADSDFANDDRASCQPFSLGTRNCIGKNLAYREMYLILAKLLWHFDLSAGRELDEDWFDQKAWSIRFKKPLWVKLTIAER